MKKSKLDINDLKNVCGGTEYLTISGFVSSEPTAIVDIRGIKIAFNPGDGDQVFSIVRGNPTFEGSINLEDNESIPKYSWRNIHRWFKNIAVPKLYRIPSPLICSPTPPIPEIFNVN